ncbi:DNA alkylation repair protein [Sphingorhabdus sp.]|uniref:DNA alkylation repair protein n=1 Tax=Sphingorhabdus sp. TaxID=1902408 RepID=UPI0032B7A043
MKPTTADVQEVLKALERVSSKGVRDEMSTRYGVHTKNALGVAMRDMLAIAKEIGVNHRLALALWDTGGYEARMVASMIDDPALVTSAQMERWCKDFDNWGICDTVCFKLFDRTPHAWAKIWKWAASDSEFVKRAGFALLWALSLHDKSKANEPFVRALTLVEREADDDRHLVKKAVSMALKAIGRRSPELNKAALAVATKLSRAPEPASRWVGRDAARWLVRNQTS